MAYLFAGVGDAAALEKAKVAKDAAKKKAATVPPTERKPVAPSTFPVLPVLGGLGVVGALYALFGRS